jgi:uncharacterized protein YdeI (YjbR/CyaY-like superfamily)
MKSTKHSPKPLFFATPSDLRKWFEKNHNREPELLLGFYKKASGKPSVTWSESVDQAICFGWIDGIRKSIDEESYMIRFTPRRPSSIWSAINLQKVKEHTKLGLMHPAGLAVFNQRDVKKAAVYSFEQEKISLDESYLKKFKKNKKAWDFFQSQAPYYQRTATHWVMSAKQEETRHRRLEALIADSERETRIKPLRKTNKTSS